MNGSTAKIINKAANKYRMNSKRLKRAYHRLNHIEKGEAKANMHRFCMDLKTTAAKAAKQVRKETIAKVEKQKAKAKSERQKAPLYRRFIAWIMGVLGIWNFETRYRFARELTIRETTGW